MKVIELKITLKGIKPLIWRRIKISSQASLLDLHYVIQRTFGWTNSHLFMMEIGSMRFVNPPDWEEDAYRYQSAEIATLKDFIPKLVPKGGKFSYEYDMGDGWQHEIVVENIEDTQKAHFGAICVSGERACPPEDVGSTPGYYELLEDIQDPTSDRYKQVIGWLGYAYDPEVFDLKMVNQSIRDYFKSTQLSQDTYWVKNLPLYNPRFDFTSGWLFLLSTGHRQCAESLAFRRDMVTLLTYLRDNKVKGTKATGNFPRKDIRALAAVFVNPPELDLRIGDRVYQLRTEDEVPELIFLHNFANAAGLILGGENMLWSLTSLGDMFLTRTPEEQAWFLTKFWFYQFNWEFSYQYVDIELNVEFYLFQRLVLEVLLNYPTGKPVEIERVLKDIDKAAPDWISVSGNDKYYRYRYFLNVVVKPLEKLGFFETIKDQDEYLKSYYTYTHIIMTDYGKTLLKYFK